MKENKPENTLLWLIGFLLIIFAAAFAMQDVLYTPITWTQAKEKIEEGSVSEVIFNGNTVQLKLKQPDPQTGAESLETVYVFRDESFIPLLESKDVSFKATAPSSCEESASLMVSLLLIGLIVFFFVRMQRMGSNNPFGRSKASLVAPEDSDVRFDDVAGVDEAVEELEELVSILKEPQKFLHLGGRIPKGILLVGPPGTGKTLLARAVAGEADVPFFQTSGSDFVEIYVGVGAARVRDLFAQAKKNAPCIIFIDELDAIGKTRSTRNLNGNDEREQTLNQLLVAMDGFDSQKGIIVIAATNRPDSLDKALLRPGRFDRQVEVGNPDMEGRMAILNVHAKNIQISEAIDFEEVAKRTQGFSGADLANLLNEAVLLTVRRKKESIGMEEIEEGIERSIAGLAKKNRNISQTYRRRIAYHEGGHALCAAAQDHADPVLKISIVPRGRGALGYTMQSPDEEQLLYTQAQLRAKLVVMLGGRAAEQLIYSDYTTGAADDLKRATSLARRMIKQFGMNEEIGPISYEQEEGTFIQEIPEDVRNRIEKEVNILLRECAVDAINILKNNKDLLEELVQTLLEQENLRGEILDSLLERAH
ncbi:MAG: cell division protein FtsH [Deltaproteobacteria bacterium]|nr:cell division protein FtsH [Deltaproteobacteria bacterium]